MIRFIEMLYADPLLKFLVDTTMKSFVIFAVAGLFAFCLRRKSAAVRGFVWSLAIIGCLIIPLFSLVLPKWELGILPEAPVSIASSQLSTKPVSSIPIAPIPPQPNPVTSQSGPLTAMHWTDWIAIVWAGVGLFLFIRLIVGIGAIWHVSARSNNFSRAVEDFRSNWNRRANVRLSNRITVPIVWGFLRPVILLPVDANHWRTERLRAVLLHELAHIERWDWVVQTIAQVTCAVYWFNPIVWFAAYRMRIEAEQACDDQVLNAGYRSTDYAQHLLDITRDVKIANTTSRTAVAIARSSKIEGRLRTVLAENLNRHPVTKVAAGIGLLVFICFAVPMSAMHLAQAVNPEETLNQQIQEVSMSQSTPNEDRSDETTKPSQADKNIEICKQHLVEIGKAIETYKKEHGDFPEWLSDLHPKHLADANTLICPADEEGGKTIFPMNTDPKMPVSYGYQFHPEYREEKSTQREMYGDIIPLVRCRHHENEDFDCLNLSFSSKIYKSSAVWEFTPEDLYGSPEAAITAFENALARYPDDRRFFDLYPLLVRLHTKVGNEQSADTLIERLKSGMIPDLDGYRTVFDIAAQKSVKDADEVQDQKNIDICTQNLTAIGKAIQAYHNEHDDFPDWLSELYPKYLSDANLLLCPADEEGGKSVYAINEDPKMPVSYGYQFHPKYREEKTEERLIYGDVIPLTRCRHHENQAFECLNLSFAFKVYSSSGIYTPEEKYGTPKKAIVALEVGLQRLPDSAHSFFSEQASKLYHSLVRLYNEVGREKDAENLINRFKSIVKPDDLKAHFVLGEMLEIVKRDKEALAVFEKLEKQDPDRYGTLTKLAEIHWKLGNSKIALEYHHKTETSRSELIGKPVPDFSATDLDGKPISLRDYRGKVVLLDFWAVWCGFCTLEMPNVKRVYDTYKDQGFDVIGVSLDDEEAELRDYLKKKDILWRQIFDVAAGEHSLVQQYDITGVPEPWLIARDGTLISTDARGALLEHLVSDTLKDKPKNE